MTDMIREEIKTTLRFQRIYNAYHTRSLLKSGEPMYFKK